MNHLEINENTERQARLEELAVLDMKHRSKSIHERLKPLARTAWWTCTLFQANSFFLATVGVVSYIYLEMGFTGWPFMLLAIIGFLVIERAVFVSLGTYTSMKFDDKVVHYSVFIALIISLSASTPSTYYMTAYALSIFVPAPNLIDTASVRIEQDIFIKTDTSYWASRELKAIANLKDYESLATRTNSKTGVSKLRSRSVKTYNGLVSKIDSMTIQKDIALHKGKESKALAIASAIKANDEKLKQHFEWCQSFGGILAAISAIGILLLLPFRIFYEWWERKYKQDLQGYAAKEAGKESEVSESSRQEVVSKKEAGKEKVIENQTPTSIQFGIASSKEGDIIKGEGRKADRIKVFVAGELRDMTKGDLNRLIKAQTGLERIQHLRTLKNKLG